MKREKKVDERKRVEKEGIERSGSEGEGKGGGTDDEVRGALSGGGSWGFCQPSTDSRRSLLLAHHAHDTEGEEEKVNGKE